MIYYYFKGKEGLYRAVLEKAYSEIRSIDSQVGIEDAEPVEAIRKIVEITFDYDETHPYFISLVAVENVHRGRNIAKLPSIKQSGPSIIRVLTAILERGAKQGVFRSDVNAIDLHLFISAFCVFRGLEPIHVRQDLRLRPVGSDVRARHKKIFTEAVLRYLEPRPAANQRGETRRRPDSCARFRCTAARTAPAPSDSSLATLGISIDSGTCGSRPRMEATSMPPSPRYRRSARPMRINSSRSVEYVAGASLICAK